MRDEVTWIVRGVDREGQDVWRCAVVTTAGASAALSSARQFRADAMGGRPERIVGWRLKAVRKA
jgi:hypothetical protein